MGFHLNNKWKQCAYQPLRLQGAEKERIWKLSKVHKIKESLPNSSQETSITAKKDQLLGRARPTPSYICIQASIRGAGWRLHLNINCKAGQEMSQQEHWRSLMGPQRTEQGEQLDGYCNYWLIMLHTPLNCEVKWPFPTAQRQHCRLPSQYQV